MSEAKATKLIDIERIIREKNPGLHRMLPKFLIRWIGRKIHADQINYAVETFGHLKEHEFNEASLAYLGCKVSWENEHYIPGKGGVIIAANHPLGGLDGLALTKAVSSRRTDTRFIVNDVLKHLTSFGRLFVGVNKMGKSSTEALRQVERVYQSEEAILIFPAGLVSRKQKQGIQDLKWNKNFVVQSQKNHLPIIPAYVEGKNSNFFYQLAHYRKKIGIKANLEMFFLPDEMFKQKNKSIHIRFGPPIQPEWLNQEYSNEEWAQLIKAYVYSLKESSHDFLSFKKNRKQVN